MFPTLSISISPSGLPRSPMSASTWPFSCPLRACHASYWPFYQINCHLSVRPLPLEQLSRASPGVPKCCTWSSILSANKSTKYPRFKSLGKVLGYCRQDQTFRYQYLLASSKTLKSYRYSLMLVLFRSVEVGSATFSSHEEENMHRKSHGLVFIWTNIAVVMHFNVNASGNCKLLWEREAPQANIQTKFLRVNCHAA